MKCPECGEEIEEKIKYNMFGKHYKYYCENCGILWNEYFNIAQQVKVKREYNRDDKAMEEKYKGPSRNLWYLEECRKYGNKPGRIIR